MTSTSTVKKTVYIDNISIGTVLIWNGSTSDIPPGWQVCDGSNGTIDLRNRFVVSASHDTTGNYPVHSKGGNNVMTLDAKHMPNNWPQIHDPGHGHISHLPKGSGTILPMVPFYPSFYAIHKNLHVNPGFPVNIGISKTGISIPHPGKGVPFLNAPQYYLLFYIQKIS